MLPILSASCLISIYRILALATDAVPSLNFPSVSTIGSFSTSIFNLALSISKKNTSSSWTISRYVSAEPKHFKVEILMILSPSNSFILFLRIGNMISYNLLPWAIVFLKISMYLRKELMHILWILMLLVFHICWLIY